MVDLSSFFYIILMLVLNWSFILILSRCPSCLTSSMSPNVLCGSRRVCVQKKNKQGVGAFMQHYYVTRLGTHNFIQASGIYLIVLANIEYSHAVYSALQWQDKLYQKY